MDLHSAIQTESLDIIRNLIARKGFNTSQKWLDYDSLITALKCGRKNAVELILKTNCRVNRPLKSATDTPLHHAVYLADPELVSLLIEKKASVIALNTNGNSPLHLAFLHKQGNLVDLMLDHIEKNSNFFNAKNSRGLSHLHIACTTNNAKAIEGFLNSGASILEVTNKNSMAFAGYNCLHFAAEFKSLTAIKIVLPHDTNARARLQQNSLKKTPSHLINEQLEDLSVMDSLMKPKGPSPFHLACVGDDPKLLQTFLDNVNPNYNSLFIGKFCNSFSPLHFATMSSNSANVQMLLRYGARADNRNGDEMTPLQLALYSKSSETNKQKVMNLYNATENKINQQPDKNGLNFMHVASSINDIETVEQFLNKSMDVNSKVTYERQKLYHYTPLHFAIKYQNLDMVKYLIKHNAEINCGEDCVDGTPLHLACEIGNQAVIDFLLDNGADVKAIRPYDKKTPLHRFVHYCLQPHSDHSTMSCISKLVNLGVDINAQDTNGNTVLHLTYNKIFFGTTCAKVSLELGADINIENNDGNTPFNCQLLTGHLKNHVQPGDYTILYHHVQKLKAIGFQVNSKNEACCKRLLEEMTFKWNENALDFKEAELARKQQERTDEIARMKSIKLTNDVSLYDFVRMEPSQAKNLVTHYTLMEFLQKDFPVYGHLMRLQHQKAVNYVEVEVETANKRKAKNEESGGSGTATKRYRSE